MTDTAQDRFDNYPIADDLNWQATIDNRYMIELVNAATAEGEVRAYKHILRLLVKGKTHD